MNHIVLRFFRASFFRPGRPGTTSLPCPLGPEAARTEAERLRCELLEAARAGGEWRWRWKKETDLFSEKVCHVGVFNFRNSAKRGFLFVFTLHASFLGIFLDGHIETSPRNLVFGLLLNIFNQHPLWDRVV